MSILKKILNRFNPLLKPIAQWYLSKTRNYFYKGIHIKVYPGIFHPGFFFSTKFLLRYLSSINLKNRRILELGAGTGLLSIYCYKKGATVVATDIHTKALRNLEENIELNKVQVSIIESDLFDQVNPTDFDLILINPPYYAKKITSENVLAWYCGENFEYFDKLFSQLAGKVNEAQKVIMILSEDCDLKRISTLATQKELALVRERVMKNMFETNYIFTIQSLIQSGS